MMQSEVLIYTTAWCPFCIRAKKLLEHKQIEYTEISLDADPSKRQEMMARSQRRTVPQIFIGDTHVGGCDDLFRLEMTQALDPLLSPAPTTHNKD
ncbi:glutaredoxin 3 [Pontibacter sp. JAM-7]|uniref:glutaredoxin 3 n=1 Tax=Pontibacter sp. JAM-7 TaxID=3366581 RepID=UPI003AF58DAF